MSVTSAGAVTRRQLVQRDELDPKWEVRWSGSTVGDASAGSTTVICTVPTDLAIMFVSVAAELDGSSTANVFYNITQDGSTFFQTGAPANVVQAKNVPQSLFPPRVMFWRHPVLCTIEAANVDGDDLFAFVFGYGWELQIGRNLPQKFFWPALLT